jgi:hypothetical protein
MRATLPTEPSTSQHSGNFSTLSIRNIGPVLSLLTSEFEWLSITMVQGRRLGAVSSGGRKAV